MGRRNIKPKDVITVVYPQSDFLSDSCPCLNQPPCYFFFRRGALFCLLSPTRFALQSRNHQTPHCPTPHATLPPRLFLPGLLLDHCRRTKLLHSSLGVLLGNGEWSFAAVDGSIHRNDMMIYRWWKESWSAVWWLLISDLSPSFFWLDLVFSSFLSTSLHNCALCLLLLRGSFFVQPEIGKKKSRPTVWDTSPLAASAPSLHSVWWLSACSRSPPPRKRESKKSRWGEPVSCS